MARRVFISYRRSDEREAAVRIGGGLAARFGRRHVFIDIDSLLPGARYDDSLLNALNNTDVLIAVIGPRWKEIMAERSASHERDYVLDEIAGALARNIAIIPVRVGHQGALSTFPNEDELPPPTPCIFLRASPNGAVRCPHPTRFSASTHLIPDPWSRISPQSLRVRARQAFRRS
jgi:hypothetical protein